jgi:hypothetical protein
MVNELSADNSGKVIRMTSHSFDQGDKRQAKITDALYGKVCDQAVILSPGQRMFLLGDVPLGWK